jgi:RNA polymerase sigma-70 factor (ECF subfamily)
MTFNEVYIKHYNELRRFGRQLNISSELIEDLVQETFLRFYLELKKGISFENPRAWLYKVFLNLFKTDFSSNRIEVADSQGLRRVDEPVSDFQEEYTKNEKQRIVIEVLDQMEKKDKEILMLYNNGFSYAEMAEVLEINPNSVGKTLVRAIEKLKETLKIQYHEMFEQN